MQTLWGELSVNDAHIHFFSHHFFSQLAAQARISAGADGGPAEAVTRILGWQAPPPEPRELAEAWARELARSGVSKAALISSLPGDEPSVVAALERFPERFYGYFMVNPLAPDALARVDGALSAGLQGICLFPAMHRYSINDPHVEPILQAASTRAGVVVFVHCGLLTVGVRRKLGLASPFDMRYSNPIDLHPMALLHPQLQFVIPHFGAGYLREALMLCDLCSNVSLDTSSSNSWVRYQAPEIDLKTVFRRALDVAGPRRLLFGTDSSYFPRGWNASIFEAQQQTLMDLGIGRGDAEAIFGGNLERLLSRA
ncbi:MAG TPA: amidohydrolase family protein [Bryobacteraceae bacterium]|nr:amidohydrolase family protein [Bryobacteraceae bacterium]